MFGIKKITWEEIVLSYSKNPRDVKTVPFNRAGIWFYVYVENGSIYIENAKNHSDSSSIKIRRKLKKENLDAILSLYYRRKRGESVAQEATEITYNQVYWYGIFADMCIWKL